VQHPLEWLGWNSFFEQARTETNDWSLARITAEHKGHFQLKTADDELLGKMSGKLRHEVTNPADLPAVGDWVEVTLLAKDSCARVEHVLPRRTKLARKAAGRQTQEQVLVANIDTVFVVSALNHDLNQRRIERYLALAWDSGARPVLLLNKADLCPDAADLLREVENAAPGVAVLLLSAATGSGMGELRRLIPPYQTAALVGSSGVGKSTIINRLLGHDLLPTQPARESDDRGRHTTTARQMHFLPSGGMVIDTPGLRELQLWENSEGVDRAFEDINAIAQACRFRDCTHGNEPGCAVQLAISTGQLPAERLESRRKLEAELRFLERKVDAAAASREKDRWKKIHKDMRRKRPVW